MRIALFSVLAIVIAVAVVWFSNRFSHFGTPPDPNRAEVSGLVAADVLRRTLSGTSDSLLERVHSREISDDEFKDKMAEAAQKLLKDVNVDKIPSSQAWEYGEMYITARNWDTAKTVLERAVEVARDDDRRVNDSLRLARVYAELGNVKEAVLMARTILDVKDAGAAPILPATLFEIIPAAKNKGADADLAALLEDAIACHVRTIVDPTTTAGRDFLSARPYHVRRAWTEVIRLYEAAGDTGKANAAREKMQENLARNRIA